VRRALFAVAFAVAGGGCNVDTELGVGGELLSTSVVVTGADATAVVAVTAEARFRAGTHAEGPRVFIPQAVELVDSTMAPLVQVASLSSPGGPADTMLEPGEERAVTLMGMTTPGTFTDGIPSVCAGAPVGVILRWQHRDPTMPMMLPEFDLAESTTSDVTCP
jgi:hypothetical protein